MDPKSLTGDSWTWAMMEPELNEQERALRDLFVDEFLVDYSPLNAARRCGFSNGFAEDWGKKLHSESYVQRQIAAKQAMDLDPDKLAEYDKKRIRAALMREAHAAYNSGSSRVAALGRLMSLYGMDAPTKIQSEVEHRGGVMMVPAIASLDDWEKVAMASQQKLSEDARSDIK